MGKANLKLELGGSFTIVLAKSKQLSEKILHRIGMRLFLGQVKLSECERK